MERSINPIIVFDRGVTSYEVSEVLKEIPRGSNADIIINGALYTEYDLRFPGSLWVLKSIHIHSLEVVGTLICNDNICASEISTGDDLICSRSIDVNKDIKVSGNIICNGNITTHWGNITVAESLSCDGEIETALIGTGGDLTCNGNISARDVKVIHDLTCNGHISVPTEFISVGGNFHGEGSYTKLPV